MHRFDRDDLRKRSSTFFHHPLTVRFQDVDAAGIVFFARVAEYIHDGYVALLDRLGSDLPTVLREKRWAAPIRHLEVDYFNPIRFGDDVRVALVATRVDETEIALGWQVLRASDVVVVGQTVHAFVNAATFQRIQVPSAFAPLRDWR